MAVCAERMLPLDLTAERNDEFIALRIVRFKPLQKSKRWRNCMHAESQVCDIGGLNYGFNFLCV